LGVGFLGKAYLPTPPMVGEFAPRVLPDWPLGDDWAGACMDVNAAIAIAAARVENRTILLLLTLHSPFRF